VLPFALSENDGENAGEEEDSAGPSSWPPKVHTEPPYAAAPDIRMLKGGSFSMAIVAHSNL
jgi:hypothetical protein